MKGRALLLRPWGDKWQVWEAAAKDEPWKLIGEKADSLGKRPADVLCGVPARRVLSMLLRLDSADEATVLEMARLEVEMRGLAAGDRLIQDVSLRVLLREEGQILVLATVFPAEWPDAPEAPARACEPSPLLSAWEDNTLHLWREFDELVAAAVWKGMVVCWETADGDDGAEEIGVWLRCLMLQLREQVPLGEEFFIKDWAGALRNLPQGFSRSLPVSDRDREEGPTVAPSPSASGWLPSAQREIRDTRQKRRTLLRAVAGAAAVLVSAALAAGFYSLALAWKTREVDRQLALIERQTAPLRNVAARWQQVEPAVDEKFFPLEMLHAVVSAIPSGNVRLTVFEMSPEKLLVEGEAGNVSAATDFFKKLQGGDSAGISWEMPPPLLQANNKARFVITGERIHAE